MTTERQAVIEALRALSLPDRPVVLRTLAEELYRTYPVEASSIAFWSPKTIEELVATQSAPVITDVRSLATDFWPEDESAEEINQFIADQRKRDRLRET